MIQIDLEYEPSNNIKETNSFLYSYIIWSSTRCNVLGRIDTLFQEELLYLDLKPAFYIRSSYKLPSMIYRKLFFST